MQPKGKRTNRSAGPIAPSACSLPCGRKCRERKEFADTLVHDFAAPSEHRASSDFVIRLQLQLAVVNQVLQERSNVPRIHLARVIGHGAREIDSSDDRYAISHYFLARSRQLAIPTAF